MVNTRSPSWTGGLPEVARKIGAGAAFGKAARFTDKSATSFWASAAIKRAWILCPRSNCTAKYSELPTTCWLVRRRPFLSTKKPVPWPIR